MKKKIAKEEPSQRTWNLILKRQCEFCFLSEQCEREIALPRAAAQDAESRAGLRRQRVSPG